MIVEVFLGITHGFPKYNKVGCGIIFLIKFYL